jgi:hypothetical protein
VIAQGWPGQGRFFIISARSGSRERSRGMRVTSRVFCSLILLICWCVSATHTEVIYACQCGRHTEADLHGERASMATC